MKERPIIFNDEMVRAILDGRKTQTRRVAPIKEFRVKNGKLGWLSWLVRYIKPIGKERILSNFSGAPISKRQLDNLIAQRACAFGCAGDRLWVRECFADDMGGAAKRLGDHLCYRADPLHPVFVDGGWTPSIHMPRWASRITLEITNVRVERLQDISDEDALAEGVHGEKEAAEAGFGWYDRPRKAFASLWRSIYGTESWESNHWVWVIEFKRLEQ